MQQTQEVASAKIFYTLHYFMDEIYQQNKLPTLIISP